MFFQKFTPHPLRVPSPAWQSRAEKLSQRAHEVLLQRKDAQSYLAHRGVGLEAVKRFNIGLIPQEIYENPEKWDLDPAIHRRVWVPAGILIPAWRSGKLVRLRIRRKAGTPKYVVVSGSVASWALVLPPQSLSSDELLEGCIFSRAIVTESELDAFALWGLRSDLLFVATGSALNRPDAELHTMLQDTRRILFIPDYDEPGKQAARWWKSVYPQTVIWPPGIGKDPGEMFEAGADVWAWLKTGLETR